MIDISVSGLVKEFEVGKKILDGLTFQVDAGERVGLLGPNGCGKTTFLRILTGEVHPDEGDIVVAPNKRMGLISQIPVYPAGYTVEDVLDTAFAPLHEMEAEMTRLSQRMAEGESDSALLSRYDKLSAAFQVGGGYETDTNKNKVCNGLSIPQDMRERPFDMLSGGEKTRVNLARLILEDTDILLLDEPTNHLDLHSQVELIESLKAWSAAGGRCVVGVFHDMNLALSFADTVLLLDHGQIQSLSSIDDFDLSLLDQLYHMDVRGHMLASLQRWV